MAKRLIETFHGRPLLDIASYARRGPNRRDRLGPEEVALISRTVSRTPEVVVKVLTRGGQSLKAVCAHLAYLNRGGELEIQMDDGEPLTGERVERRLLQSWDLDIEAERRRAGLRGRRDPSPPKLVHKILLSMPPGTHSAKVLSAVKNFAREEFGVQHRYAMVLHVDEPHPHVHLVVKAVSEEGIRLNIRKDTLRRWRAQFARHLRGLGIAANATERAVRGESRAPLRDSIYRADQRGESRFMRQRRHAVVHENNAGKNEDAAGNFLLAETRRDVDRGWRALAVLFQARNRLTDAARVLTFVERMPPVVTDGQRVSEDVSSSARDLTKERPARTR